MNPIEDIHACPVFFLLLMQLLVHILWMTLASCKSRLVLPFWYQLNQVVLEKKLINGCSSSSSSLQMTQPGAAPASKSIFLALLSESRYASVVSIHCWLLIVWLWHSVKELFSCQVIIKPHLCVCVCACARARVRACVCACQITIKLHLCVCVRACVRACVR